jgi:hypothetical protein
MQRRCDEGGRNGVDNDDESMEDGSRWGERE